MSNSAISSGSDIASATLYGYELYGERVAPLEERVPEVIDAFNVQIHVFLDWLTGPLQK